MKYIPKSDPSSRFANATNTPTSTDNTNRSQKLSHIRLEAISIPPSSRFLLIIPPLHPDMPLPLHAPICSARHTWRSPLLRRTPPSPACVSSRLPGGIAGIATGNGPLRCILYFSTLHLPPHPHLPCTTHGRRAAPAPAGPRADFRWRRRRASGGPWGSWGWRSPSSRSVRRWSSSACERMGESTWLARTFRKRPRKYW